MTPILLKALPFMHVLMRVLLAAWTLGFLIRIILTWYPKIDAQQGLWSIIYWTTEPFLKITRTIINPIGGVDITPVIWFGLVSLARELLVGPQGIISQMLINSKIIG